ELAFENPKSPSRVYRAAPRPTGPVAKELGTKSIPVNEESAASMARGDVIGCGGRARTDLIGTSSLRMRSRLAAGQGAVGLGSGTHRSSPGPPTGLNTAWLASRKPSRSGHPW